MSTIRQTLPVTIFFVCFAVAWFANGQETKTQPQPKDFASEASLIVGTYQPQSRDHSAEAIVAACKKFIESLSNQQILMVSYDLDSPERREWTNLPPRPDAGGVRIGDMSAEQVKRLCDFMANLFSEQGYAKLRDIMMADDQLIEGQNRNRFGTDNFSVVVFGQPATDGRWAFQIDGHHVGVNVSINGDQMTMSPSFIGTQPEAFTIAGKKYEPFAGETGDAYALLNSLSDEQIKQAVLELKRGNIVTGPGTDGKVPEAKGVPCSTFDENQKQLLIKLVSNWVNDLPSAHAEKRIKQLENEIDQMKFSWNGNKQPGSDISYTIQGPSLIIEYACQDLGGKPLAHLHSMYRDPTDEYGKQLD